MDIQLHIGIFIIFFRPRGVVYISNKKINKHHKTYTYMPTTNKIMEHIRIPEYFSRKFLH